MSAVRFGGSEWPLRYELRSIKDLEDYLDEGSKPLRWFPEFLRLIAADDTRAIALAIWAGIGANASGLEPIDVLDLMEEVSPEEDEFLASGVLIAIQNDLPGKPKAPRKGEGDPWDWDVGLAAWSTEWKQLPAEFWDMTLREFSALSDGRALLYASVNNGGAPGSDAEKVTTLGGWLELLKMRG